MSLSRFSLILAVLFVWPLLVLRSQGPFDANKTYPQIAGVEARAATWVIISSPLAGDLNGNGYSNYEIADGPNGPFTDAFGTSPPVDLGGPSGWRFGTVQGLTPGKQYYFRVKYFDPDGVAPLSSAEAAVQVLQVKMPPASDPIAMDNRVEVGSLVAEVRDTEILASVPISRDANLNSAGFVEIAEFTGQPDSGLVWQARCRSTAAIHPKMCRIRSLENGKSYKVRFTVSDPDGIASGPAVQIAGPFLYWGATNVAYHKQVLANPGWGCCPDPAQVVDGIIQADNWYYGYAWPGGTSCWDGGCPAGYNKNLTIDLGAVLTFNRFVMWFHDASSPPTRWKLEVPVDPQNPNGPYTKIYPPGPEDTISIVCRAENQRFRLDWSFPACSHDVVFPATAARYLRYTFDDTTLFDGLHGWIVEAEVFEVPRVEFSASALVFPATEVGKSTQSQNVSVKNVGDVPLQISSVTVTGKNSSDFVVTSECPSLVPPGGPPCNIRVVFSPGSYTSGEPIKNAILAVNHNGPAGLTQISLTGTVIAPQDATYSLAPGLLQFGAVQGGPPPFSQNITVTYQNKTTSVPVGLTIGGENPGSFAVVNGCSVASGSNGSCQSKVTFIGTAVGVYTATLIFSLPSNLGPITTVSVSLMGRVMVDADGDGLPDEWERPDSSPLLGESANLYQLGARENQPDIFVEVDYLDGNGHSHKPKGEAIQKVIAAFQNAGYHLHVDCGRDCLLTDQLTWGDYSRSNPIPHEDPISHSINELGTTVIAGGDPVYNWTSFDILKLANFGPQSDAWVPSRWRTFHYAIFAHSLQGLAATGLARTNGSDFIVSLGPETGALGNTTEQAGTFMHELGHNLSLDHGGFESKNHKPNYPSVMNYFFQTRGVIVNGLEGNIDYLSPSRAAGIVTTLSETALSETLGIGTNAVGTRYYCNNVGSVEQRIALFGLGIDWDCSGAVGGTVQGDINGDGAKGPLTIQSDWDHLKLRGGAIGGFGVSDAQTPVLELTVPEDSLIKQVLGVRVIAAPEVAGAIGQAHRLDFQVLNESTVATGFHVSVVGAGVDQANVQYSLGGSPFVALTNAGLALSAGATPTVRVPMTAPGTTGTTNIQLIATSVTNPLITDSGITAVTSGLADLAFSTIGNQTPVLAGQPISATFTIINRGPDAATDAVFKLVLPSTMQLKPSPGVSTCQGVSTVYCYLGTLPPNTTSTVQLVLLTSIPGALVGTGTLSSKTTEANPSDNATTANFTVVGIPKLSASILNARRTGSIVTATLRVRNDGQGPAAGAMIQTIDGRVLAGSGTIARQLPVLPLDVGPIAAGQSKDVTLQLSVSPTVSRIGLTESGVMRDSLGNSYSFSAGQAFVPAQ